MSDVESTDKAARANDRRPSPTGMSSAAWVVGIVALILVVILYYGLRDRYTPITSECYLQAYVTGVAPQVAGTVHAVRVEEGQQVKAGQLLFELTPDRYAFAVEQLQAELALARSQVALMRADLDLTDKAVEQATTELALLSKDYDAHSAPAETAPMGTPEDDQAHTKLRAQEQALQQAMAERSRLARKLAAKVGDRNALVVKAEAALDEARYQLAGTKIVAPSDGYVTNLQLTAGTYVGAGEAVISVVDSSQWWVVCNFPENSIVLLEPGQPATVTFGLVPGRLFPARVQSLGWGVGEGQGMPSGDLPQVLGPSDWVKTSQRFPVRLRLDDPDAAGNLRVGGTVTALVSPTDFAPLNAMGWFWLRLASLLNFLA